TRVELSRPAHRRRGRALRNDLNERLPTAGSARVFARAQRGRIPWQIVRRASHPAHVAVLPPNRSALTTPWRARRRSRVARNDRNERLPTAGSARVFARAQRGRIPWQIVRRASHPAHVAVLPPNRSALTTPW